jgi:hypothetical protein
MLHAELQREAFGLRPREERPDRRQQPRHHPGDGHLRLRRAGVRRHRYARRNQDESTAETETPILLVLLIRALVREERRVRFRRGAAGDADGPARDGHGPPRGPAQPGGLGQAFAAGSAEAGAPGRPAPRGPVPVQGRAAGGPAHAAVPRDRPQEPALHGRGRRLARGHRADQAAAPERARAPQPLLHQARRRLGRGAEQPAPVSDLFSQ